MSKKKPLGSGDIELSHPFDYRAAGYSKKKAKKLCKPSALRVIVWPTLKPFRRATGSKGEACLFSSSDPTKGQASELGPVIAVMHLAKGRFLNAGTIAHELVHALAVLPREQGDPFDDGKLGEVAAYRMQRLTSAIIDYLEGLGLGVPSGMKL